MLKRDNLSKVSNYQLNEEWYVKDQWVDIDQA